MTFFMPACFIAGDYEYSPEEAGRKRLRSQQEEGGKFQGGETHEKKLRGG